jgi:hypothetical protein
MFNGGGSVGITSAILLTQPLAVCVPFGLPSVLATSFSPSSKDHLVQRPKFQSRYSATATWLIRPPQTLVRELP